jgi:MOSC domain-containing protein YiiM
VTAVPAPHVSAVCVVADLLPEPSNPDNLTAIDKRPVAHAVPVGPYGLAGDLVKDHRNHGGLEQAVYVYADADAAWWAGELGIDLPPGAFGENLRVAGIEVTGAEIGQRWRIGGDLELELTSPRIPCATFARHLGRRGLPERGWVKRFTAHGAPGGYFAVTAPGTVTAGDPVAVVHRPGHGVTLGEMFRGEVQTFRRLLDAEAAGLLRLHDAARARAREVVAARG